MTNWWLSREQIKAATKISGTTQNAVVDRIAESVSRQVERSTRRFYIPRTETRLYEWPPLQNGRAYRLWLDTDLLSVTTLQAKAQDSSPSTITNYFLEPVNSDRYDRIEIDLSSSDVFESGDTRQRSISVLGLWGYSNETKSAGTVASGLDSSSSATSMVCSDASLIDVGDTLLVESEQIFVSERSNSDSAINTSATLSADKAETTIAVGDGAAFNAGEVILVDSERMYIESISGNNLTVVRGYDGSTLASHSSGSDIYYYRTLTIERGVNGTTAATHADSTAVSKYEVPFDINMWAVAEAVAAYHQEQSGWGRTVGTGEGQTELSGRSLQRLRDTTRKQYQRLRLAAV